MTMTSLTVPPSELKEILLQELDYTKTSGLESSITWTSERPIEHIESAYMVNNIPIVYISSLRDADQDRIWRLHRAVWSQSRAPLLYVILPQEIRVYNGYAQPSRTPEELDQKDRLLLQLQQLTDAERARQQIRREMQDFARLNLETGAFWDTPIGKQITPAQRADQRLLTAMEQVRWHLLQQNLGNNEAYALLGRSIFIRYLEDRRVLTSDWMMQLTDGQAAEYRAVLADMDLTYLLFDRLSQRFNGDLFPVDRDERETVKQQHLDLVGRFLAGDDLDSGQQSFWPYDFQHIPIELISGIYDTFLYSDREDAGAAKKRRRNLGAYYTPLLLVEFLIEKTLPLETTHPEMMILDPACGSGTFLVRSYQRLVEAWKRAHTEPLTAEQLASILRKNIFGVDVEPNAIRIAELSLYLVLLDYLEPEAITAETFRFPPLEKRNLLQADFFSPEVDRLFGKKRFDRIIGNLPWGRATMTEPAEKWIKAQSQELAIGAKQIAQAFLHRTPDFCSTDGELVLLAPAKSTIFVLSGTHTAFRRQFLERYRIREVVNFSALVYGLFAESLSPAVALIYQPGGTTHSRPIVYSVPKPSVLSERLGAIVIDASEVKYLTQEELLDRPALWKIAQWGTPRDAALIERLHLLPRLRTIAERLGWNPSDGIIKSTHRPEQYPGEWLIGLPEVPTNQFRRYVLDMELCSPIQEATFHRPRTPDIVKAPIALIHRSPLEGGRTAAAFSEQDVAYLEKVTGFPGHPGQEMFLKWLVTYINSSLAQYYLFLTSTSWAVERGTIVTYEYLDMPFLVPALDDSRFLSILEHFDGISDLYQMHDPMSPRALESSIREHEQAIDELIFELFEFTSTERQLVYDLIEYEISYFYWAKQKQRSPISRATQRPDRQMLQNYAKAFIETATALLHYQGQTLDAQVYQDGAPLTVIGFELTSFQDEPRIEIVENSQQLRYTLHQLDRQLLEQQAPALYTRRYVRIYDGPRVYLVRPSERRYWTRSQARADADSFIMEVLASSTRGGKGAVR